MLELVQHHHHFLVFIIGGVVGYVAGFLSVLFLGISNEDLEAKHERQTRL